MDMLIAVGFFQRTSSSSLVGLVLNAVTFVIMVQRERFFNFCFERILHRLGVCIHVGINSRILYLGVGRSSSSAPSSVLVTMMTEYGRCGE